MASKRDIEKKLEYARGYRDALVDTWESVIKLATKGYSSRELQIMSKTLANDSRAQMESKIAELEADFAQDDIIDIDEKASIPAPKRPPSLKPGMSIMFKEPRPVKCYEMFQKEIATGRPGICIGRLSPREIRDGYDIAESRVIWLTNSEKMDMSLPPSALGVSRDLSGIDDEYIQPSGPGLPMVFGRILEFIEAHGSGIILLEGLEYLVSHNSFQSVMGFLQKVNENVKASGSNFIISVNHSAFDQRQYSQLETEMSQVI